MCFNKVMAKHGGFIYYFIHMVAGVRISFYFKSRQHFVVRRDHTLVTLVHVGLVGCFHFLATLNIVAMNSDMQISL